MFVAIEEQTILNYNTVTRQDIFPSYFNIFIVLNVNMFMFIIIIMVEKIIRYLNVIFFFLKEKVLFNKICTII